MIRFNLPGIGLRNVKTAISVMLCIIIFKLLHRIDPFYACISAVICMKDTVDNSLTMGKNRLLGTLVGGVIGTIFIYTLSYFKDLTHPNAIITGLGIIIIIYLFTCFNKPGAVSIACIVFISIMVHFTPDQSYDYAISRTIDTAIGILVAVGVNYILPNLQEKIKKLEQSR